MTKQQPPKRKQRRSAKHEWHKRIDAPPEDIANALFADADARLPKKPKPDGYTLQHFRTRASRWRVRTVP